ncbi:MAG: rRNA maturation RNase YbeY [Clostridia bacterium]|nr:rRNA maturation RNase YbeY [Clostridia bacterium]
MIKVKVNISDRQKAIKLPTGIRLLVRKSCVATLNEENFQNDAEVNVTFVDDAQILKMNKKFRNIDNSTDVLSFPLGENGVYDINPETGTMQLGDVVISVEHAFAQADLYGHTIEREVAFLTVHSMLHLLGYDHVAGGLEAAKMRDKEEIILANLGLAIIKD